LPWFTRAAVLADAANGFEYLGKYAWNDEFYWGVDVAALGSRVWRDIVAVDDIDLAGRDSVASRKVRLIRDVAKGMSALCGGEVIDDDLDVDLWKYRYFGERSYVHNLVALADDLPAEWDGQFMVHEDALCWERAIIRSEFRYKRMSDSEVWSVHAPWERRTLSALGRFVPYHMSCCYNLTEAARDRLIVRLPVAYRTLQACQGFVFEQEPVFSYLSHRFIADRGTSLWVVAYTERVVRLCAALLVHVYSEYKLWYLPPDVIAGARKLGMAMSVALGSEANVAELMELLEVIESTRFEDVPVSWSARTHRAVDYHPGRLGDGGDFVFYDPWERRKIDPATAESRVAATRVLPMNVAVGWCHNEIPGERSPRDVSRDYDPLSNRYSSGDRSTLMVVGDARGANVVQSAPSTGDAAIIRRFLERAGVLGENEAEMSVDEMRAFVRGRLAR
jgi:hypothetical protein